MLPFVIEYQGRLVGQLTVAGITWGSMCSGHVGYWVDREVAGRGVMPTAVALAVDHCFRSVGLHRIEVCIRPENGPSRRVVEKLGFREEGLRPRYLHIDGAWRDHLVFALTAEEVPEGLLSRWHQARPGTAGTARNKIICSKLQSPFDRHGRSLNDITKKVRDISQIVRHTGPIGGWPSRKPLYGVRREQQRPHLRSHRRGLGRLLGADVAP